MVLLVRPPKTVYVHLFKLFLAELDSSTLDALRANPGVKCIDEDGIMHINRVQ
jgi:hypothetical protein